MRKEFLELPSVAWACLTRPRTAVECLTTWEHRTLPLTRDPSAYADVILAMEFGQHHPEPTCSNVTIARIASYLREMYVIPICAQDEAADCVEAIDRPADFAIYREGDYINTEDVIARLTLWCAEHHMTNVLVVTHPLHQWRVMRTVEAFGLTAHAADCSNVRCDPDSLQDWCRSEDAFKRYEIMARMLFLGRNLI